MSRAPTAIFIASRRGAEALIIDPVLEKVDRYLQLMNELDLRLVKAVDTHLHVDHAKPASATSGLDTWLTFSSFLQM